ncbi:hypothetical protein AQ1_01697 [alpha proteobacterium Q-1]|nr:hypothetical protein AQ1_01697 [alpha proteobacterium Q-1]
MVSARSRPKRFLMAAMAMPSSSGLQRGAAISGIIAHESLDGYRVLVIDDLLDDPDRMRTEAATAGPYDREPGNYYPGLRAPAPAAYGDFLAGFISHHLAEPLGLSPDTPPLAVQCLFSLVTQAPESLLPIQSIPHFDSSDPGHIAVVHYLFKQDFGGTSFYRHKGTGHDAITSNRARAYQKALAADASRIGLPKPGYMGSDSALFARTAQIAPRYNRAVVYPGCLLHAGDIGAAFGFSSDPLEGRLTITSFLRFPSS